MVLYHYAGEDKMIAREMVPGYTGCVNFLSKPSLFYHAGPGDGGNVPFHGETGAAGDGYPEP
jgi:hypothetical protein